MPNTLRSHTIIESEVSVMSAIYRGPSRGGPRDSRYQQQPRTVIHSQIFWFKMPVSFSSPPTASQAIPAYTESEGFDAILRGGWTDLAHALVTLSETETNAQYSSVQIPVRTLFGNSTEVAPTVWWHIPIFLQARNTVKGDWLNQGTENAGTVCFFAEKQAMYDQAGHIVSLGDGTVRVTKSQMFYLKLDLSKTTDTTLPINNDTLIWGASTNIESSAVTGKIIDQSTNFAWSSQTIPILAMCGQDGQPQPILRYAHPYFLPANVKLQSQLDVAAASGSYMSFLCERIYR